MQFRPLRIIQKIYPSFIWSFSDEQEGVFLTFDDGPSPDVTPWVLDRLQAYGARATFFCIGKNVELFPDLFQEIKQRGHRVGNHSYSHVKGWGLDSDTYIRDVDMANDLIRTNLFRAPYARITPAQARLVNERFYTIMWSVLSRDYNRSLSPQQCAANVLPYLDPGAIVVFHDSLKCERNMKYALEKTLDAIYEKGLICKPIIL
ncbi:MAG: polysaccharide deacetylase family protein [Bacteroidales bacterium]|nr:polysaccharide deacetylase family protein [Bacteroidales bacterium]